MRLRRHLSSEDGFNQNAKTKGELKEVEEKFRKAIMANESLENEKCQLMFQVIFMALSWSLGCHGHSFVLAMPW